MFRYDWLRTHDLGFQGLYAESTARMMSAVREARLHVWPPRGPRPHTQRSDLPCPATRFSPAEARALLGAVGLGEVHKLNYPSHSTPSKGRGGRPAAVAALAQPCSSCHGNLGGHGCQPSGHLHDSPQRHATALWSHCLRRKGVTVGCRPTTSTLLTSQLWPASTSACLRARCRACQLRIDTGASFALTRGRTRCRARDR